MKRSEIFACLLIGFTLIAIVHGGQDAAKPGRIEASEIVLRSPDGQLAITISANDNIAGIWLEDKKSKRLVAIYQTRDQAALGVYANPNNPRSGVDVGMSVDANGDGFLQMSKRNKVHFLDANGAGATPELK